MTKKKVVREASGYVGHWFTRFQDGSEEGCKLFNTKQEAIDFINKLEMGWDQTEYALFELGKRIPIKQVSQEEPQPPIVKKKYILDE